MYVLGVHDAAGDPETVDRIVGHLVDVCVNRGRVGVARYDATIADGTAGVRGETGTTGGDVTYEIGADGDWAACGTELAITDALDVLARDCEYAIVVRVPELRYPSIVVGSEPAPEGASSGPVIETVSESSSVDAPAVVDRLETTEAYETLESLVARVKRAPDADRSGAIGTFTGRVRAKDGPDDTPTEHLEFEKYGAIADERLNDLKADLEGRDGVFAVELHHRTGLVRSGEDIVFVVVLAGHREQAFRTVEDGINRLKAEVPLFKKEVTVDEEFWVHDRP